MLFYFLVICIKLFHVLQLKKKKKKKTNLKNISENSDLRFENINVYCNSGIKILNTIILINNKIGTILNRKRNMGSNTLQQKLCGLAAGSANKF